MSKSERRAKGVKSDETAVLPPFYMFTRGRGRQNNACTGLNPVPVMTALRWSQNANRLIRHSAAPYRVIIRRKVSPRPDDGRVLSRVDRRVKKGEKKKSCFA